MAENKGKLVWFLVLILVLLIGGKAAFYICEEIKLNRERYELTAPMPDLEYKKAIIKQSGNKKYKIENLRAIVGPDELKEFLKTNNNNPQIYTPSEKNIKNGIFRANLHMHTVYSDGMATVQQLLDMAQKYAENNLNGESMYMAITDHNTILGTKELVRVLQNNPDKYDKVRVVLGIEIFSAYNNSKLAPRSIDIHVLTLAINPYDEFLNKEFYKKYPYGGWNRTYPDRDFDRLVKTMSNFGIVGIAHPARYTAFLGKNKYAYVEELMTRFREAAGENLIFTEGYYQVYPLLPDKNLLGKEYDKYLKHINVEAQKRGILLDGSTDVHGLTIFNK